MNDAKKVSGVFERGQKIIVFLVTIGGALEEKSQAYLEENERAKHSILDAVGKSAVGELATSANNQLDDLASKLGFKPKVKVKPGQNDWSLAIREALFKLVSRGQFGVQLTSDCQFRPRRTQIESIVWDKDEDFIKKITQNKA